jgi:hypothetical protein
MAAATGLSWPSFHQLSSLNMTSRRYPPTYRQDELHLVCNYAREGRSLCLVGVAGVGKSNIINLLRYDPYGYKPQYLPEPQKILFPVVDGNAWNGKPQYLWELMLEDLIQASRHLAGPEAGALRAPPADPKILQLLEEQRTFSALRSRVEWLTGQQALQIMFLLDDFDRALSQGPLSMLEQLSALRKAGNRNQLAFLIFCKNLPQVLGRQLPLDNRSQFYSLFRNDIFALEPYEHEDTQQMLVFINENAGRPLRSRELAIIGERLSGGHAGLAKVLFERWRQHAPDPDDRLVDHFSATQEVQDECRRIVEQLHPDERRAAAQLARGGQIDGEMAAYLERRGLLATAEQIRWRSPLLRDFLRTDQG